MMKNLMAFYELASQAVDSTAQLEPERRILWATIRDHFGGDGGLIHKLTSMKFKARLLTFTYSTPAQCSNFLLIGPGQRRRA